jgi:predicted ribosomally synthesized peptide with nif11-like leader
MNENLKLFFNALGKDAALQKKLEATKSSEEAYQLALTVRSGFTPEEFLAALKEAQEGALSDEDLDAVAGGRWTITVSPAPDPIQRPGPFDPGRPQHNPPFGVTIKIGR